MMNLFQRDSQQSSGEMHWVVLRAEQKLQVWAPEHWSAHQHFVASFESFICCFQSLQPVFLVQFLKRLPAHTPWLPPLLRLPWDFNFRSINMYQTHLHTHFSHLGHAFERLKHLFWFGLSKVQAINSAGYVFHDKLIIMPSSHLRALHGEIKWEKWLNYLYWLLIKRYNACLVEKQCLCCIFLRVKRDICMKKAELFPCTTYNALRHKHQICLSTFVKKQAKKERKWNILPMPL